MRMKSVAVLVGLTLASMSGAAKADTFKFSFDNNNPFEFLAAALPAIAAPSVVGTGTLSFDGFRNEGVYAYNSFQNLSFSFSFNDGQQFYQSDVQTPTKEIQIALFGSPGAQTLRFSNTNPNGSGPNGGSLDLANSAGGYLSFESPGVVPALGVDNLYYENSYAGSYTNTDVSSVPLPASAPMFGAALLALGAVGFVIKRKKAAFAA